MKDEYMLTTVDNPYSPFDQFNLWFMFDVEKGYYTCSKLARVCKDTEEMSDKEIEIEIDKAIDAMIEFDFLNIYKRVSRKDFETKRR